MHDDTATRLSDEAMINPRTEEDFAQLSLVGIQVSRAALVLKARKEIELLLSLNERGVLSDDDCRMMVGYIGGPEIAGDPLMNPGRRNVRPLLAPLLD